MTVNGSNIEKIFTCVTAPSCADIPGRSPEKWLDSGILWKNRPPTPGEVISPRVSVPGSFCGAVFIGRWPLRPPAFIPYFFRPPVFVATRVLRAEPRSVSTLGSRLSAGWRRSLRIASLRPSALQHRTSPFRRCTGCSPTIPLHTAEHRPLCQSIAQKEKPECHASPPHCFVIRRRNLSYGITIRLPAFDARRPFHTYSSWLTVAPPTRSGPADNTCCRHPQLPQQNFR